MALSVGIVGLPNVGKSTLFNALLKKQQAYVANFPFATIEPNIGVVPVPDDRLKKLAQVIEADIHILPPVVPATVTFVDIAGLIAGASKGEGLGNKFLSHIRETSAICHVVRVFNDVDIIKEGTVDPKNDLEIVEMELKLADLQTVEAQNTRLKAKDCNPKFRSAVEKLKDGLEKGLAVRVIALDEQEAKETKQLSLLTAKPILVVLNVSEGDLNRADEIEKEYARLFGLNTDQVIAICAKTEMELADLSEEDQKVYLKDLGVEKSGLERLIKKAFATLGLITFLTAGEKEVRAWTIREGTDAQNASGEIHTDFIKKFIKADVVEFNDFVGVGPSFAKASEGQEGGWKFVREHGLVRSEGKDYIVKDGDVIEFKIGS